MAVLKIKGFAEFVEKLQAAEKEIKPAVTECMRESALVQEQELKKKMTASGVDSGLINRMPPSTIDWEGNRCEAKIGYSKGAYNPADISDGYKAVFLNYGTPRITPRNFIAPAKKSARPKIKKAQEAALQRILEETQG